MAIERVAVIGAGTMGAGIAQVCAQAGWTTALYDAFPEGLERGEFINRELVFSIQTKLRFGSKHINLSNVGVWITITTSLTCNRSIGEEVTETRERYED